MKKFLLSFIVLSSFFANAQTFYMMPNGVKQDSISLFTPLYNAIAAKQPAGSYVDLSTGQTIQGVKTFQGSTATDAGAPFMIFKNSSGVSAYEFRALSSATNTAIGVSSFPVTTTGVNNTALGYQTGLNNTTGSSNTFFGYQTGGANTTGAFNNFLGSVAGYSNTIGNNNIFSGYSSGYSNTTGNNNIFEGYQAGNANVTGSNNVVTGYKAAINGVTLNNTITIGQSAARYITGGSISLTNVTNGVYVGDNVKAFKDTATNEIVIGGGATGFGSYTATIGATNNTAFYFNGTLNAKSYGTGTNTGTAAYDIRETAGGQFIEVPLPATAFNTITATASQTAFAFTLVPAIASNYQVFKNGILLLPTTQYTTSGNTITLLTGAAVNDVIALQRLQ